MRARYYDPETARFLSREPVWLELGDPRQLNPYQYAFNEPVGTVDITGLDPQQAPGSAPKRPTKKAPSNIVGQRAAASKSLPPSPPELGLEWERTPPPISPVTEWDPEELDGEFAELCRQETVQRKAQEAQASVGDAEDKDIVPELAQEAATSLGTFLAEKVAEKAAGWISTGARAAVSKGSIIVQGAIAWGQVGDWLHTWNTEGYSAAQAEMERERGFGSKVLEPVVHGLYEQGRMETEVTRRFHRPLTFGP